MGYKKNYARSIAAPYILLKVDLSIDRSGDLPSDLSKTSKSFESVPSNLKIGYTF